MSDEEKPNEETGEETGEKQAEEKSDLQVALEEERDKNKHLNNERIGLGRTVKSLTQKVDELTEAFRQKPVELPADQLGSEQIEDDDYLTSKSAKQVIADERKKWESEDEKRFEQYEQQKEDKVTKYNEVYSKEFARLSMEIEDNDFANAIATEHDTLFSGTKEPTGNPEYDARIRYAESKSAYISKMASAGKELPFKGKPPTAALGVGGNNPPVKKEKEQNYNLSDSAKEYLASAGKSNDKEFLKRAMTK